MASGKATVKQVVSGNTILLMGVAKGGPPPEKQINLASVMCPSVAMRSLSKETDDEPFGWNAREFVRKKLIGKQVDFQVEYLMNNREHGWIKIEGESISHLLLKEGLARLKPRSSPCAVDYDELEKCQEIAKEARRGLWHDESGSSQATIRNITWAVNDVACAKEFADKHKGERLAAIVEYVRDAACVRVLFTDPMFYCSVLLSGIQCDGYKRETENGQEKIVPEGYAAEAKFYVESRLLNREVEVRVEGADDYGNIFGTLLHPNGNITLLLLSNGFAKLQDWSLRLTESPGDLREHLKIAQTNKLRKWKDWKASSVAAGEKEYNARVQEISSGDCVVLAFEDDSERRVYFASIRCPRLGYSKKEDEAWAYESKEFTRKKLIGKKVRVVLQYVRNPMVSTSGAPPPPASDPEGRMHFVSLFYDNGKTNIAEELISQGLARTIPHRGDDDCAENFDVLLDLEKQAELAKVGLHSPEASAPKHRINDLTGGSNSGRARAFEAQLVRIPKLDGVVDYVVNAARLKIRIPAQNLMITFALAHLRCPQTARPAMGGQRARESEPFADEAMHFTKSQLMQRSIQIKIDFCDKGGTFFGTLFNQKLNFSVVLLEKGFAAISSYNLAVSPFKDQMLAAENKAKAERLKMWSVPGALETANEEPVERELDELIPATTITHINSILDFYIQESNSNKTNNLRQLITSDASDLETFAAADLPKEIESLVASGSLPRKGEIVVAKFSLDGQWYRGRVESRDSVTKHFNILYIDFGNSELVPIDRLRKCPARMALSTTPAQAIACSLSGLLQPPDMESEAAQYLHDEADGKIFQCKVERIDETRKRHVILTEQEEAVVAHPGNSLNEKLVRQGLARIDKLSSTKMLTRLKKEEEVARKSRTNIWRYGDVGDDDDGDDFPSLSNGRGGGGRRK